MFYLESDHFFNGSYGVVPQSVLAYQRDLSVECERNPYRWFTETYQTRLADTKRRLAPYLGADPSDFVFVDNSTSAANSVFDSLCCFDSCFDTPAVVIILETAYGMIKNLLLKTACRVVTIPVDVLHLDRLTDSVHDKIVELQECGFYVTLVCLDHIASAPGVLMPIQNISAVCKALGVSVLVDGAHALGQVRVNLGELAAAGVTYWFTDAHKWFFSPKGSAILWVCRRKQPRVRPSIDCAHLPPSSHSSSSTNRRTNVQHVVDRTFAQRFEYLGTKDYTPWLAVSAAIDFVETVGGYDRLIERNRKLALWARDFLSVRLQSTMAVEDAATASMCNVHLPTVTDQASADALHRFLRDRDMHVIVCEHPRGCFWLRLCAQLFVTKSSVQDLWIQIQSFLLLTSRTTTTFEKTIGV